MIERLRALLERPLDPAASRLVVVLASAVCIGFAGTVALGLSDRGPAGPPAPPPAASADPTSPPAGDVGDRPSRRIGDPPRQDPQDRPGSPAASRADRELADHRGLQHVPWRRGGVRVTLVGARGDRAVLQVEAPSLAAARRGWRGFLRAFDDPGDAYLPVFRAEGGRRAR